MLSVHKITLQFADRYLFRDISFQISKGEKIGLVGKNGAGKSTLLKILSAEQEIDKGNISKSERIKIGFLKQDLAFSYGKTVRQEIEESFEQLQQIKEKIEDINIQLQERTDYESDYYLELIDMLNDLTQEFDILGGYTYTANMENVLKGLGFKKEQFDKLTDEFSGGWRMRVELAKLLLSDHDILLLDEPTNHLDIDSIIWLEDFLKNYQGAVVLVSHDKQFLDNITNRTLEIVLAKIYDYKCNYSRYLKQREDQKALQVASKKNQDKEIKQTQELIDRFRYKASKAAFAQSLIKKLDKIERIEVDEEDHSTMRLSFYEHIRPGKIVLNIENVRKSYGDKTVLSDINLLVERGSKIAFVGQNGQGKTTLAKIILGQISYEGKVNLGHNVQLGYCAQNYKPFTKDESILSFVERNADKKLFSKVRDYLGAFMFSGDQVYKKIKVLSGGERGRLALCNLLLQPSNVLIMDEPTNHLDITSKERLKQAFLNYTGTLIIVSHDRDFLQGLTNRVYEFKDTKVKEYIGDIDYYLEQKEIDNFRALELQKEKHQKTDKAKKISTKGNYQQQKKAKQKAHKINKIEEQIEKLEKELAHINANLSTDKGYTELTRQKGFFEKYHQSKALLQELMNKWEKLQ